MPANFRGDDLISTETMRKVPMIGRIGFIMLGVSFLFWSILMAGSLAYGVGSYSSAAGSYFLNTPFGPALGIMSMGLTVAGVSAAGFSIPILPRIGKAMMAGSISAFAALQLVGLYFLFYGFDGGIIISTAGNALYIYLLAVSLVYALIILIYANFLVPFLRKSGRRLVYLASFISVGYLLILVASRVYAYLNPPVSSIPFLPGDNLPSTVSTLNPFFGVPGFLIGGSWLSVQIVWALILPLASNAIYAALCLHIGSADRTKSNMGTSRPHNSNM